MSIRSNGKMYSWIAVLFAAVLVVNAASPNCALASHRHHGAEPLEIYFIDVEGGQATLVVTPHGHSLLIDTGFAGKGDMNSRPGNPAEARDANRIVAAARTPGSRESMIFLLPTFIRITMGVLSNSPSF